MVSAGGRRKKWSAKGISERILMKALSAYLRREDEAQSERRRGYIYERPIEYSFALTELMRSEAMTVLDVGTGGSAFPALLRQCGFTVTASDSKGSYWKDFRNRHIWVHSNDITSPVLSGPFDAVAAISSVEHIENADRAVQAMSGLLKPGGVLVLSFPYSHDSHIDNVYDLPEADPRSRGFWYIAQSFCDKDIDGWKARHGLSEIRRTYVKGWSGKYWRTGDRLAFPREADSAEEANCLCISLRTGT